MTAVDPQKQPPAPTPSRLPVVLFAVIGLLTGIVVQEWRLRGPAGPAADDLRLAEKAFRQGDDGAAFTLFSKLADQNNPNAQYWLGHMIELGLGVPRDLASAIDLYKKAAAKSVVAAQLRLGEIYLNGDEVPPDFAQAKSYLEKAAYQGNPRAAMLLGEMYRLGLGLPVNAKQAYSWYEVARLEGSTLAERERDASFRDLAADDQKEAIARAQDILAEIKKETIKPNPPIKPPTSK